MRYLWLLFGIIVLAASCDSSRPVVREGAAGTAVDTVRIANDSLEYEITIIEPGFYSWLATQPGRNFFTLEVMEMRNQRNVQEYNRRVYDQSFPRNLYVQEINYDPKTRYGVEVNYLLFHYFRFFEQTYKQRLQ